jgi:putative DNA primase/helicase
LISYDDQWKFLSEVRLTEIEGVIAKIQGGSMGEMMPSPTNVSDNPLLSDSITDLITAENFVSLTLPPRNRILSPWLYEHSITLVARWRNTGKTWFGLSIFDAVTREDGAFGPWKVKHPVPSLYVDSEMTCQEIQERIKALMLLAGKERAVPFYIYSDALRNLYGLSRSNLLSKTWREEFKAMLLNSGIKLVGFDNISSLTPGIDENLKRDWDPINQWFLELRFEGISSVLFHHAGKTGFQRGTSAREDNIDSTILLECPPDYMSEEGVRSRHDLIKKG